MKAMLVAALLAQAVPDGGAPPVYLLPAGSVIAVPTPDGPPDVVQLPAGFFVPEPSMRKIEADTRTMRANLALRRAEASEEKNRMVLTAAIAASLGLILGAGVMCVVSGPSCPVAQAFE